MSTMTQTQTITLNAPSSTSQPAASTPIAEHAITLRGSAAIVSQYFSQLSITLFINHIIQSSFGHSFIYSTITHRQLRMYLA